MTQKTGNFFESNQDLNILTSGSKYLRLGYFDIAVTRNQNLFIKLPNKSYETQNECQHDVDYVIGYLADEGFLPKTQEKKKVKVWVYN